MKFLKHLFFCISLTLTSLHSQDGTFGGTPSFEPDDSIPWIDESAEEMPVKSFGQFDIDYESIFDSHFKNSDFANQEMGFGEGNIILSYTRLLTKDQGYNVGGGYTKTTIFWDDNPFFNQDNFDTLNFSLNGFTKCFNCLELKGGASISIDTHQWAWDYNFYTLTGWGRYVWNTRFCGDVGINFGATSRLGLKRGYLYPIFGVDLTPWEDLQMNLIFPTDMAVIYRIAKYWSLDLRGKLLNSRRRLDKNEVLSRGYFDYISSGIELGLNFECDPYAAANFHVGTTLGNGELRVSNTDDLDARELKISAALYIGGKIWFRF
ncbi:MAG: hypothetical protein K940chlam3_00304 [Chlamydiae bacterium]|nr:hypothetical protein [Chlamydiota bacterium]